ncbi:tetratricopeptide repeat-containing sensor histidine kinase [Aureibacter tunicatorum]|uniref:histidine kinase n=1 Tax=Aureibacter tunicatorum TaxID=866807 RepID=A0AAE3XMH3_9BACT|nr:ATP-binding protein [Aureibacter tunicatorum]MDR6239210.1 signal transduction histidine kinase [Aureibacter tunicatorum]BDD04864.1 hypothetical protein AUTU_23470 [Aureibacter tunicatorum]
MVKIRGLILLLGISLFYFDAWSQQTDSLALKEYFSAWKQINTKDHLTAKKRLLRLYANASNEDMKIRSLGALGQYYNVHGDGDSSIYFCNKTLKLLEGKEDEKSISRISLMYNTMGIAYLNQSMNDKALEMHINGVEIAEKSNNKNLYFTHIHGLARAYLQKEEYEKSISMFMECINSSENPRVVYASYINIGSAYSSMEEYELSIAYARKALKMCADMKDIQCEVTTRMEIATSMSMMGKDLEAYSYLEKAYDISKKNAHKNMEVYVMLEMSQLLIKMQKMEEASAILIQALVIAEKLGHLNYLKEIYADLESIMIFKGDYEKAHAYLTKINNITDSIHAAQNYAKINELEVKYQTVRKEKEILKLKNEKSRRELALMQKNKELSKLQLEQKLQAEKAENRFLKLQKDSVTRSNEIHQLENSALLNKAKIEKEKGIRNLLIFLFFIILIPVVMAMALSQQKSKSRKALLAKQEQMAKQQVETLLKNQELKLITATMSGQNSERQRISQELHDSIGGSLAAIKLQLGNHPISENDLNEIYQYVDKTYGKVREISHALVPKDIELEVFTSLLSEYFDAIENSTYLKINRNFYPYKQINELPSDILANMYCIIQELVSNAVKHANASNLDINLSCFDNELSLVYEDDGDGFDQKLVDANKGIGLMNIQNRVKSLHGELHIDTHPGKGVNIVINLPININENVYEA